MAESDPHRYRAFISYSQRDRHHAKRLHSALETYRVPKGIDAPLLPNRRLGRFFRDDDEMGASTDLGATLRDALENSENLIVICSPHAARSKWVNAEVLHFKSIGRGDRIFAVVVDGIPNSDDPDSNCFPPALRFEVVGEELLSEKRAEPLGIDLRKERFPRARLRLAAGLMRISFDSLWQREKRRTVKRRAIAALVTLMLGFVIVLLGTRWLTERGRVHAQRIDRTLVTVRDDLASERVKAALVELERLNADAERGAVDDVLTKTLSWMSPPSELLKEIKAPAFISNGPQLFFLASNGSRHLLNIHQPYRRILSSDRRWLLIIGADEAALIDVLDGRELARTGSNQIQWIGHAFETGSGLLIVGGRFSGTTNGTIRDSFLVFSPQRQTLSLFNLHDYWNDSGAQPRFIDQLAVSADCSSFGVAREGFSPTETSLPLQPSDIFTFSADTAGLKLTPTPASLSEWRLVAMFDEENQGEPSASELDDFQRRASFDALDSAFKSVGCKALAADSANLITQPGATGAVRPIGLGAFWEPERKWKVVRERNSETPRSGGEGRSETGANSPPCTEERPCRVQDPEGDQSLDSSSYVQPGWTSVTRPRGVHKDDRSFDYINKELLYEGHDFAIGGFRSAWCRNLNSKLVCLEIATGAEFQDELTESDLRSTTGRWIFYPRGAKKGLRLYDLLTMRNVTPKGPELVASTHSADFSTDDNRLFVTMNGRLLVFTPPSDGGPWQQVSDGSSVQIPALSGNEGDRVAGLFALDNADLIVVRNSGVISRFDWRTGQQSWGRTIGGVGEINRAIVSRNRAFLLVIGKEGGRLLDTKDGLVLSGVLVPPSAMEGSIHTRECFNEAFVSDTGVIEVACGEKEYRREQSTFDGDVRSRLRQILSDELLIGSN
jgi:hypothetical protein